MRFVASLFLIFLLLLGCVRHPEQEILDLRCLPQSASAYLDPATADQALLSEQQQQERAALFRRNFYRPWHVDTPLDKPESIFWAIEWITKKLTLGEQDSLLYGANLRPYSGSRLQTFIAAADRASYPSLNLNAITLRRTAIRALPTLQPCFLNPAAAGEGYPFDYLQNSLLEAGVPIKITHRTVDGAWLLIESVLVSGWVQANNVALVDGDFIATYEATPLLAITVENIAVSDDGTGHFRFYARIGTLLPQRARQHDHYQVLLPINAGNGWAKLATAQINLSAAGLFPMPLNSRAVATLADWFLGQNYGWGGSSDARDCSATLRDLFIPFGIWLPRNSSKQAEAGETIALKGLSLKEKEQVIAQQARAYFSLLCMPGHIMLSLGNHLGYPVVLHTMWGLKTSDLLHGAGRKVVGKTVITTLQPGIELLNLAFPAGNLLYRIDRLTLL
mgnify:CR=1 FL=1